MLGLPQVRHRHAEPFDDVCPTFLDTPGLFPEPDTDPRCGPAGFLQVVAYDRVSGRDALHVDCHAVFGPLSMTRLFSTRLRSQRNPCRVQDEQDADFAAAADVVVTDEIVGVAVADRNAVPVVVVDRVLLGQAVFDAPAEEEADLVALEPVAAHDRPLRAGTGMQAEVRVVVAVAVLDDDVVADLPTDAVAVVVARGDAADGVCGCSPGRKAAGVVAVQIVVVLFVAVEREVLDSDIGGVLAAEDGERAAGGGLAARSSRATAGRV